MTKGGEISMTIDRFGTHFLNLDKIVEPLIEERDFKLKLNSVKSKK